MSFYGWLWRKLPGPLPVRVLLAAALAVGVVAGLFTWVFPAIADYMAFNHVTVEDP